MRPECLKLVSVIEKCKLKQAMPTQENAVGEEEKDAYCVSFVYRKIGEFERKAGENLADSHRPNGWLWKRISDQVARNSLEWIHWERFLNMSEYSIFNNDHSKQESLTWADGSPEVINEFEQFSADSESIKPAKTPYFLKNSKIRKAIYVSEGVWPLRAFKEWRNTLYKAGYRVSCPNGNPSSFNVGGNGSSGPIFLGPCLCNFQPGKNFYRNGYEPGVPKPHDIIGTSPQTADSRSFPSQS